MCKVRLTLKEIQNMTRKISSFAHSAVKKLKREARKLMTSKPARLSKDFIIDHWLSLGAIAFISSGVALIYLPAGFIVLGLLLFALEAKAGS